jgi:tetratricopeptide (TPR) repeat protein
MYFGLVVSHQLDLSPARAALTESIVLLREVGDRWGLALAIQYLGEIDWRERDFATAQVLFEESAQLFHNLGDRWGHARALALVGFVLHSLGDDERARHLFAESGVVIRTIGDKFVLAALLNKQGQVLHCLNEYDQAMACFTESVTLFQELGNRQWTSDPLKNLGFIALHRGDTAQATSNFIKCIKLEYGGDNEASIAICLAGLAGVAVVQGRYEWAARLYGAATAVLLHVNDDNPDPSNQRDWDQGLATLKAQCDPIDFAAAWAAGQALSLEQAVAEALGDQ